MESLNKIALFSGKSPTQNANKMYKQKRKSQVFIAAQSLNDELLNLKSLKRMSIGSTDDLDTRDLLFGQFGTSNLKMNKSELETIQQENEGLEETLSDLRHNKRLTIESSQYPDFYDNYNDENASSDEEVYSDDSDSINNITTINSIENSYNITSAEYLDENSNGNDIAPNANIETDANKHNKEQETTEESDEDKEFTSSLLWVPANKHPSIKPDKYLKYVQGKLETFNAGDENEVNKKKNSMVSRSRSSNIETEVLKRGKSFQENEMVALNYASRSKSLTRKPSRLRKSFISQDSEKNDDDSKAVASTDTRSSSVRKSRFSLKEITEELSKMSQNAGFSGNDAVSLARSLSMSINKQKSNYEDDLDFENDNYYDSDFHNTSHESDETSSPTSPTSPSAYILKANSIGMFDEETEKLKKRKGKYQPSYELEIQPESEDDHKQDFEEEEDDYVIGLDNEKNQDVGRRVTRGKTIKQMLQQQQKEIEEFVSKDRKISLSDKESLSTLDEDEEEYASTFDKEEMKSMKKSSLQRSKFNTYREKSFKNKIHHFNTLKNSKSVDGLTISTKNLLHSSNTPSPTTDKSVFEQQKNNYETISSSDTGSMHTADDSLSSVASVSNTIGTGKSKNYSNSNESLESSHSSNSNNLSDKHTKEIYLSSKGASNATSADNVLAEEKSDDHKKKNKFYNILKKSKFKFNKNKDSEEESSLKKLTINTDVSKKGSTITYNKSFNNVNLSPDSNTSSASPSSPIKLPSFSSKRTLSGSNSKQLAEVAGNVNKNQEFKLSSSVDDKLPMLNQRISEDNRNQENIISHVYDFKLNTIDDEESILSPLSPSDMNMFDDDFDMSDNDVKETEQALLISNEDICLKEEPNSDTTVSCISSNKIPSVSKTQPKAKLFSNAKDGNHTSGKRLFNHGSRNSSSESVYSIPPLTPPASPTKIEFSDDQTEENGDNLPPRKLTFKDVHRPLIPNSPMKYRDSSFGFPLPSLTISTVIMFDHRLPVSMERAIYRLSHMKLSENKRELRQQVLLSNFMYSYLNLVNHSLYLQKLEEEEAM